jgi:hypothetical protein
VSRRSKILDGPQGQRVQRAISEVLSAAPVFPDKVLLVAVPDAPGKRPYVELLAELEAADDARDLQPARFAGDT